MRARSSRHPLVPPSPVRRRKGSWGWAGPGRSRSWAAPAPPLRRQPPPRARSRVCALPHARTRAHAREPTIPRVRLSGAAGGSWKPIRRLASKVQSARPKIENSYSLSVFPSRFWGLKPPMTMHETVCQGLEESQKARRHERKRGGRRSDKRRDGRGAGDADPRADAGGESGRDRDKRPGRGGARRDRRAACAAAAASAAARQRVSASASRCLRPSVTQVQCAP